MRISGKGLVDRGTPVGFRFDGRDYAGFEGDTLASALLASGVRVFARSFKYHRPRGVMTSGSEEPNALVTVGSGAAQVPNVRATVQEIHPGLEARGQNCWPGLRFDVMAVNDALAPFIGAGFYYKTFMWPRALWEALYEPAIRRAAGLGALSGAANEEAYEKAWAFCDLLVIGAGPAGLMAARAAARAGAEVILADEDARMGGRLLAESGGVGGMAGADWAAQVVAELAGLPNVRLMTRTTVTGAYDGGTFGALERVALHRAAPPADLPRECFWRIVARRAILASGAHERPIAFANNDRPGVMMAGAARAYLNRWGVATGHAVTLFTNNDDAYRTARDLKAAGVEIAGIVDVRPDARSAEFHVHAGYRVIDTVGRTGLREVVIADAEGQVSRIVSDCLAVSGGWNPALQIACHHGGKPVWNDGIAAFVPRPGMVPGLAVAGAANGAFSTRACLAEGQAAASEALAALGRAVPAPDLPEAEDDTYALEPYWEVPAPRHRAWVDFANDVTTKDVRQAAAEAFGAAEHMKRYTTQGMAPDQGKTTGSVAMAVLADATGREIAATGITTARPPYTPVTIAAMGAGGQGAGFAPERFSPADRAARDRGAPMVAAGLWYRASYFPRPGEPTWRETCDREVAMVRERVGVADVTTLGKIDVQGADAGKLLDFVYANTISTLAEGRIRYGLMLREDGMAMDDGTVARLGAQHFLISTTTAAAGQVMRHLDFVQQALRPGWDARTISVTEHWAQFAVAGPLARRLLDSILAEPLDPQYPPYLGWAEVRLMDVPARLFRISFSGELGYEIAVPARYGAALFRDLVARAENLGGGAYGLEAMNVLRLEKGFLTHAEMTGRVTAADLGLGRMVAEGKDCIGKAASRRPGLMAPGREELVGLRPIPAGREITAGALLFAEGATATADEVEGHVTSAAWSPTLRSWIALGLLRDGRARRGKRLRLVDHLRGIDTQCEVTDPVFYDKDGGRARG